MADPTPRTPSPAATLAVCLAIGVALGLVAIGLARPELRAAWLLLLGAVGATLVGPLVASTLARGCGAVLAFAIGLFITGAAGGVALDALAGGLGCVTLWGCGLAILSVALGAAAGPVVAALLGLALLSAPWWAARGLVGQPDRVQVDLVLLTPLPALTSTFGEADLLRAGSLYRGFPAGHSAQFSYPTPARALLSSLLPALLGAAVLLFRLGPGLVPRRGRVAGDGGLRPLVGAALVLLLFLGGADSAQAQAIMEPTPKDDSGIGDLETRVSLGYWLPDLRGFYKLDGENGQSGNDFSFNRHLDLDPLLVLPTFEIGLQWENGGRIWIQYMEAVWHGETQLQTARRFEEVLLPFGSLIEARYKYRSIAFGAELHIPLYDLLPGAIFRIIQTTRYIKHETKIRAFDGSRIFSVRDSLEAIVPVLGIGGDVSVWGPIFVYADIQWLDFRTSIGGGADGRFQFHHREWKAGARLELVDQAHVLVEYFSVEHSVKDGKGRGAHEYDQSLNGIRVQVAVKF